MPCPAATDHPVPEKEKTEMTDYQNLLARKP
jgi:hypothetical protein